MDFDRLAEVHFGVSLETVSLVVLLLCPLPLIVAFGLFRYREHLIQACREHLLKPGPFPIG